MTRFLLVLSILLYSIGLPAQKIKTITEKYLSGFSIKKEYTVLKKNKRIKHGSYQTFFEGGQIELSGTYDQNRKTGMWKEFNPYGELRRVRTYRAGRSLSDEKYGIWKETTSEGKLQYFDYDKNERVFPQIPLLVKYPSEAREENISGVVKIKATFNQECEQTVLTVVKSLRKDFDAEALKAVKVFLKKLKFYAYDCSGFNKTFTITFEGGAGGLPY